MKATRLYTLLVLLLMAGGVTMHAQEIILTGVVSRVDAPYFEQNVCNDRFAIVSEGETYYVMVDNYWPNPYLEDLVIHYDTIPVGNEIEVKGTVVEMEDGNGEVFQAIDISNNLNSTRRQIFGFFDFRDIVYPGPNPVSAASFVKYSGTEVYYVTIDGELQTEMPLVVNGRTLIADKRYLFVGENNSLTDYNGNVFYVFELIDALPYDTEDSTISGTLTTENDLCLSWPRGEAPYLSVFDGEMHRYVTNKGVLQNRYTLYDIRHTFGNNTPVVAGGFEAIHHDLFGVPFNAMEVIKLETEEQITLTGMLTDEGTPYINIGPPIPGINMSFYSKGHHYIDNPMVWDPISNDYLYHTFIVGNDTIHYADYEEVTATFIPRMIMNNYRNPIFFILITEINGETSTKELNLSKVEVFPNPANGVVKIEGVIANEVQVYNALGKLVKTLRGTNEVDLGGLVEGVYLLCISDAEGKVYTNKITIR